MSTDTLEHVHIQGDRERTYLTVAKTNCIGCLDSFTDPGPIQTRGFTQS